MLFTYRWNLSDLEFVPKNNLRVFSCFSGAGGSSMGYKMSGYDVIGCNELDPNILKNYILNLKPKYIYNYKIQFLKYKKDFPEEFTDLDILDGSPPCSTFSLASPRREEFFGKNIVFREGQKKQILSELFFDFIDLTRKLKPKVVIAENVRGLILGNAKNYTKRIIESFNKAGYKVQLFLLNGATMGLPQKRNRVFFICSRKDLNFKDLKLNFNEKPISIREALGEFINDKGKSFSHTKAFEYWKKTKIGKDLSSVHPKKFFFNYNRLDPDKVCLTITSTASECQIFRWDTMHGLTPIQLCLLSSFPLDYKFRYKSVGYCVGMSVPPIMMHRISNEIQKQYFN